MLDGRWRQADITHRGEGVCSDSSSVDNKALAVNVLLPGTLQGRNLLQMLEASVQVVAAERCEREEQRGGAKGSGLTEK